MHSRFEAAVVSETTEQEARRGGRPDVAERRGYEQMGDPVNGGNGKNEKGENQSVEKREIERGWSRLGIVLTERTEAVETRKWRGKRLCY